MAPASRQGRDKEKPRTATLTKKRETSEERQKREELEEDELEKACEKWCARAITLSMIIGPVWSVLLFIWEWATRAPMLVDLSVRMDNQHAIITGGCEGMGEELAKMMVAAGATVVLGCRDSTKADAALGRIRAATAGSPGSVDHMDLDLASFKSVRSFAADYTAAYKRLDLLVNNAGTAQACTTTEDGNEHAFQVNYLSHFLLTQLLLPTLKASSPSRVVHVTCEAAEKSGSLPERGVWGWLYDSVIGSGEPVEKPLPLDVYNLDGLTGGARCSPGQQYAMSKLAVILFNAELDDRLYQELGEDDDDETDASSLPTRVLVSHAVDPGDVASEFASKGPRAEARQSMRTRECLPHTSFLRGPACRAVGSRAVLTCDAAMLHGVRSCSACTWRNMLQCWRGRARTRLHARVRRAPCAQRVETAADEALVAPLSLDLDHGCACVHGCRHAHDVPALQARVVAGRGARKGGLLEHEALPEPRSRVPLSRVHVGCSRRARRQRLQRSRRRAAQLRKRGGRVRAAAVPRHLRRRLRRRPPPAKRPLARERDPHLPPPILCARGRGRRRGGRVMFKGQHGGMGMDP
jgi:NAD(P)-dependent dehydrogenase (short-subunit alcohol dehydrogenase family)